MAGFSEWECEHCGWSIELSGAHEFYRDKKGFRKPYGHPVACSKEAETRGVKGFFYYGYCSKCDKVRDAITHEFRKPVHEFWWHKSLSGEGVACEPVCGICGTKLILNFLLEPCPKCGKVIRTIGIPVFS